MAETLWWMTNSGADAGMVKIVLVACVQLFEVLLIWFGCTVEVLRNCYERQNMKSYINTHCALSQILTSRICDPKHWEVNGWRDCVKDGRSKVSNYWIRLSKEDVPWWSSTPNTNIVLPRTAAEASFTVLLALPEESHIIRACCQFNVD
jgi:hypothetical protein